MITCPNCGTANEPNSRFCMECGADLSALTSSSKDQPAVEPAPPPTPSPPLPSQPTFEPAQPWEARPKPPTDLRPTDPEWKMSDPGPLPEPRRRRRWLWVVIGFIAALLICCCVFLGWINLTDSGQNFLEEVETRTAQEATEAAD